MKVNTCKSCKVEHPLLENVDDPSNNHHSNLGHNFILVYLVIVGVVIVVMRATGS